MWPVAAEAGLMGPGHQSLARSAHLKQHQAQRVSAAGVGAVSESSV